MNGRFEPVLWTEQKIPEAAEGCRNCELCTQRTRIIWGEGNPSGSVIVILDNPGSREDSEGNEFVCGARQALQRAAYEAGFSREDLYVTYILKCRPKRAYDKELSRGICIVHLERQLKAHDYKAAFCLGDTAVKSFFGDPELTAKNTRGKWHTVRGLPTYASYHPLAIRRRPNLYNIFLDDWRSVKQYVDYTL
jgi:uracil-DNA glycosylase family 4